MPSTRSLRELMIDVFEYPHMPYWFTIRQAVSIMKKTVIDSQKCVYPHVILVFDEKYVLIGTLSIKDLLRALSGNSGASAPLNLSDFETAVSGAPKTVLEKPISEFMEPIRSSVTLDDSVTKAAFLMQQGHLELIPVLENNTKLAGIVRLLEIFHELSTGMLEKQS